mgnify:CR=1 FL=1
MIWTKLGILIIGFIYAGLIPFTVKRVVRQIDFDLHRQSLSFLSNKTLYDKKMVRGYTQLLFATAVLHYVFFWLLSKYYNLGAHESYMQYLTYSFFSSPSWLSCTTTSDPIVSDVLAPPCSVWPTTWWP